MGSEQEWLSWPTLENAALYDDKDVLSWIIEERER